MFWDNDTNVKKQLWREACDIQAFLQRMLDPGEGYRLSSDECLALHDMSNKIDLAKNSESILDLKQQIRVVDAYMQSLGQKGVCDIKRLIKEVNNKGKS